MEQRYHYCGVHGIQDAYGLRDDALLDVTAVFVAALADLEAPHVRVLHAIEGP
jgi:hypothetical protein